jgi:hypothetical protein
VASPRQAISISDGEAHSDAPFQEVPMQSRHPAPRYAETEKKVGLSYLPFPGGIEVPVIDLSHPAFALDPSDEELKLALRATEAYVQRLMRTPRLVRNFAMRVSLRGSRLASTVAGARSGYLGGLGTYLAKLGPDNLGSWAGKVDREVAASFPCYSARLRMRDAALLMAEEIERLVLPERGAALRLVAIAGGPAMDMVNALIFVRHRSPEALAGRAIRIDVLDVDAEGQAFGASALDALRESGGPLAGLDVSMRCVAYDWNDADKLAEALGSTALAEARGEKYTFSSEGGLFDYASDDAISANLRAIGAIAGAGAAMVGTASEAEGPAGLINGSSGAALRLRSAAELERLVLGAGWMMERCVERPLSRSFLLRRL